MTLALLLTAVTGAWATDYTTLAVGDVIKVGDTFTPTADGAFNDNGFYSDKTYTLMRADVDNDYNVTEKTDGAYYVFKFVTDMNPYIHFGKAFAVTAISDGLEVTNIETIKGNPCYTLALHESAEAPITVSPITGQTNQWTFSMPGSDVVLTPIYAKAATFATTGTEPEAKTLQPAAAEGVIAGTDASLIAEGTGIVANIGETTTAQGTLMYAVGTSATEAPALTAFSATAPTAENVADDGATVYVWYYIKGADAPDGDAATLDNTFDDTEPACLTVTVLTNKFDITLKAANANTIEAGKATVTVGGTPATVTDGKLQGVKMGSEVKLEANPGYKFRKVEVKKKAAGKPLANATTEDLGKVVGADGNIYASKDAAEAVATGNAVAMICYVNEGHGLALALSDISSYGNSWDNTGTYNEGKTAAELCSAWNTSKAVTGATWKLASKSEMNLMINAAGNYAALRDGFSAVGGTNMIDDYYWVSDESSADYAKNINFGDGHDSQEFKNDSYQVRACLEW